jgi:hypothetical protein
MRSSWPRGNWVQQDLVERFLDRWLPFARTIASYDISPVFPALEPGGNFWDTAFLRTALESLERRKETAVLNKLVLSAYAWTFNRPITWGAGGPEVWPEARAYYTPSASEDHLGFCVFDWYQAITTAVLDQSLPIILLQAGLPGNPDTLLSEILVSEEHTSTIREILNAVNPSESLADTDLKSEEKRLTLPADVLACNFWLLASDEKSKYKSHSWFSNRQPVLAHAREIANNLSPYEQDFTDLPPIVKEDFFKKVAHPIKHYLLLPAGDLPYLGRWFTRLLPYIQKHNPTIGFSLDEAFLAIRVTVAGNQGFYPDEILQQLRDKGCQVERINENGTSIAM